VTHSFSFGKGGDDRRGRESNKGIAKAIHRFYLRKDKKEEKP
jgi:hypothetical protein